MYDCVVVGGRVAGSATAALLAGRGWEVALLDRADVATPTLSTHVFGDWEAFAGLGVVDDVLAAGAPRITRFRTDVAGCATEADLAVTPFVLALRREKLDQVLLDRALAAGATWLPGTAVTALSRDGDRVTGVVARGPDGPVELPARFVVGADGRNSTVARLVGAEPTTTAPPVRCAYYAYYRGLTPAPLPAFEYFWQGENVALVAPCDDDLHFVCVMPPVERFPAWRRDHVAEFDRAVKDITTLAPRLDRAGRAGPVRGTAKLESYLRTASGPGWALVGDAGAAVHPCIGAGIDHAVRSAGLLASALAEDRLDDYGGERDAVVRPTLEAAVRLARRGPVDARGLGWLRVLFTLPGLTRDLAADAEAVVRGVVGEDVAARLRGLAEVAAP